MKWLALLMFVVGISCASVPRPSSGEIRAFANGASLVIETAQSTAEMLYEAEQRHVMEEAAVRPGATKETVMAAVALVRRKWTPLKELFTETRAVHEGLVILIENDGDARVIAEQVALLSAKQLTISDGLREMREAVTKGLR